MKHKILCTVFLLFPYFCQGEINQKDLKDFCEYQVMKYELALIESFDVKEGQYYALVPYNQGYLTGKREAYVEILNNLKD